jgi:hypothetical protein
MLSTLANTASLTIFRFHLAEAQINSHEGGFLVCVRFCCNVRPSRVVFFYPFSVRCGGTSTVGLVDCTQNIPVNVTRKQRVFIFYFNVAFSAHSVFFFARKLACDFAMMF